MKLRSQKLLLYFGLIGFAIAPLRAQSSVRRSDSAAAATPPPRLSNPELNGQVERARRKLAEETSMAAKGSQNSPKAVSSDTLDRRINAGDLRAAVLKARETRKNNGRATALPNAQAIEALYDQGMKNGVGEAFLGKADMQAERGDYQEAAENLLEASRRGSAEADYRLAALAAQRPGLAGIKDSALALLNRAASRGDASAALELAIALERGGWFYESHHAVLVQPSRDLELAWMQRAAALGSPEAAFWLGIYYMKQTKGLVDPARRKALEYLLMIRRLSPELREPSTGKTFAELEADGAIEEGLLGELERREAAEADALVGKHAPGQQKNRLGGIVVGAKRRIDRQIIPIAGDAAHPVYNLIGFSPYQEIADEGAVLSISEESIRVEALTEPLESADWRIDLIAEGKLLRSFQVRSVDVPGKSIAIVAAPGFSAPAGLRYRLVRYHTFYSIFGEDNQAGLKPAVSPSAADEIILFDTALGSYRRLFFAADQLAWIDESTSRPVAADFEITPGTALLVKRIEAGALSLEVRGMLPQNPFNFDPVAGVSLISTRKNQWSQILGSQALNQPIPAHDLPVAFPSDSDGGWKFAQAGRPVDWWLEVGLQSSDLIDATSGSAVLAINE